MTDIVEWLRAEADDWQQAEDEDEAKMLNTAAAEIERLRAQVLAQTTDNPITRAVGWWEGPIPAAGRADDAEIMRIWRECGLPEYFLGNGGSNHKLVAFAKACAAAEIERLRKTLREIVDSSNDPRAVREARAALGGKP